MQRCKIKGDFFIILYYSNRYESSKNYIEIYNLKEDPLMDKVLYEFIYEGNQIKNIDIMEDKIYFEYFDNNNILKTLLFSIS